MMRSAVRFVVLIFLLVLAGTYSCRKITLITDPSARLSFSADTLSFDTVFTSLGSSTRLFKVYNPYKQIIEISSIDLAGGDQSDFRINVDGIAGIHFENIRIEPGDSLYVFVEVTVDPNNQLTPFVITDSLLFVTNGNLQEVTLMAYGQNAHFYNNDIICNETWVNDKPYVLLGPVLVDTGCVLTIEKGVRVFMHAGAHLLVAGTLNIQGTTDSLVTFQGDRLEHFFDGLPGQWGSIIFLRGSNGTIDYAHISEAGSGIIIGSSFLSDISDFTQANKPALSLRHTVIHNCRDYGIFSFLADLDAENCLVYACGQNLIALLYGGTHNLRHITAANYGIIGLEHKQPILLLSNYAVQNKVPYLQDITATFTNCVFYGNLLLGNDPEDGEIALDTLTISGSTVNYLFDHCLVKTNLPVTGPEWVSVLKNADPVFEDLTKEDYAPGSGSPLIDAGLSLGVPDDVFGQPRDANPDIGAVEKGP